MCLKSFDKNDNCIIFLVYLFFIFYPVEMGLNRHNGGFINSNFWKISFGTCNKKHYDKVLVVRFLMIKFKYGMKDVGNLIL